MLWTKLASACLGLAFSAATLPAAEIGTSVAAQSLTLQRIATLATKQRSAWKSYLERSQRQRLTDRAFLEAELKAAGLTEPLKPPSGSSSRSMPLNRPGEWYAGADARRVADIVVSFQTPADGWSKNLDLTAHQRRKGEHFAGDNLSHYLSPGDFDTPHDAKWNYVGTLDRCRRNVVAGHAHNVEEISGFGPRRARALANYAGMVMVAAHQEKLARRRS